MNFASMKCSLLMCVVAAVFLAAAGSAQAATYDLTVVSSSGGSVTTPATGSFPTGTAVPLTATTTSFASWQLLNGSGADVTATYVTNPTSPTAATINNSVPAGNYTLIANYGHFITVAAATGTGLISGTVLPASGAIYTPGQQVTLSATTDATHGFGHWQISPTASPATDLTGQLLGFGDVTNPAPHANLQGTGYSFLMPNYDITITYTMSGKGYSASSPLYSASQATYNLNMTGAGVFYMPTQSFTVICNTGTYGAADAQAWAVTPSTAATVAGIVNPGVANQWVGIGTVVPPAGGAYTQNMTGIGPSYIHQYSPTTGFWLTNFTISPAGAGSMLLASNGLVECWPMTAMTFPQANPGYTYTMSSGLSYSSTFQALYHFITQTISGYPYYYYQSGTWNPFPEYVFSDTATFLPISYPAIALATNPAGLTLPTTTLTGTCNYGNTSTLTAAAVSGSTFTGWTVSGGTIVNTSANLSQAVLTVQGSAGVVANYNVQAPTYTVSLNVGPQGTAVVTPSQASYTYGQQVTVTMSTITAGNVLDHWVLNGPGILTNSGALTATLLVEGTDTISAVYASGSYVNTLSPWASDNNVGSLAQPFKTISKASTKIRGGQTQSIVIQQGVYREVAGFSATGSPGHQITLKSNPGDRVVITGADVIPQGSNSWTLCTSTTASGNPNYANIYYTDVTWSGATEFNPNDSAPYRFSEDEQPLLEAQTPSNGPAGFWTITGTAGGGTIIDTAHLTQADSTYWLGSNILYVIPLSTYGYTNNNNTTLAVTAYDPATSKLTFTSTNLPVVPGAGYYYLYGSPKLIGGPGQWATEALSGSTNQYRIWVWPTNGGRPDGHLYQATRRGKTVLNVYNGMQNPGYYIVDGLEVCYGMNGMNLAGTASGTILTSGGNHIVRNCIAHDNDWSGIDGSYNQNGQYIHNFVTRNGCCPIHQFGGEGGPGFQTTGWAAVPMDELWLENEDAYNACDGFYLGSSSVTIVGNYIHHNGQNGHSDGIQLCSGFGNSATILNNLFNYNGDVLQSNTSSGIVLQNNVGLNTIGWEIQAACANTTINHNTYVGLGAMNEYRDGPMTITSNLFDLGCLGSLWSVDNTQYFYSDSNLIYQAPQVSMSDIGGMYWGYNWVSWANYLISSSMDQHTITGSLPLLNAAPAFMLAGPSPGVNPNAPYDPGYSASTQYIPSVALRPTAWELQNTFTGDYIEINGDGVLRTVQTVDMTNSIITFTPSCASKLLNVYRTEVFNWKTLTCTTKSMDVSLQATSPAKGAGGGGADIGALNFNVADYMAGKLNGNTKRVTPIWPPAPVTLAAAGWKYKNGGTAYALTEGNTYTNPNMTGFQITFGAPLYAACCTDSLAVTVVDNTGTTYPINAATLDSTGTVLTIVLTNGALPRTASWIEVILDPTLMGANGTDPTTGTNGGPVTGVKSVRFTIN